MPRQTITRHGLVIAGFTLLAGCAAQPQTANLSRAHAQHANKPPQQTAFTVATPIDRIAADQRGRAVLERDVPGVMHNSHYALFSCMSLSQLASLSGGRITTDKLARVNEDLAAISFSQCR